MNQIEIKNYKSVINNIKFVLYSGQNYTINTIPEIIGISTNETFKELTNLLNIEIINSLNEIYNSNNELQSCKFILPIGCGSSCKQTKSCSSCKLVFNPGPNIINDIKSDKLELYVNTNFKYFLFDCKEVSNKIFDNELFYKIKLNYNYWYSGFILKFFNLDNVERISWLTINSTLVSSTLFLEPEIELQSSSKSDKVLDNKYLILEDIKNNHIVITKEKLFYGIFYKNINGLNYKIMSL